MAIQKDIIDETIDLLKYIDTTPSGSNPTLLQLRTLSYIKQNKDVKTTDLAREFHITPATVTSQIDRLVKGGWIERSSSDKDRRVTYLILSSKAKRHIDSVIGNTYQKLNWIFNGLSKNEMKQLYNIIKKMQKTAERRKKK
ncbi:MarR family transcriptional regulator [Candidatus Dojkabacteria bacterium]|uniref:MarR family transcriptional regulator n=1 Tax=Candidatus Dojkabacteria bacterium TaxID=2099670 RepID=A0A847VE73_9BACT|nr:MarR family transcriptional regulator [Candidatus Dojkabacteria bacterium]